MDDPRWCRRRHRWAMRWADVRTYSGVPFSRAKVKARMMVCANVLADCTPRLRPVPPLRISDDDNDGITDAKDSGAGTAVHAALHATQRCCHAAGPRVGSRAAACSSSNNSSPTAPVPPSLPQTTTSILTGQVLRLPAWQAALPGPRLELDVPTCPAYRQRPAGAHAAMPAAL